jgi:hypothetical protein
MESERKQMQNLLAPKVLAVAALVYGIFPITLHIVASDDSVDSDILLRDTLFGLLLYGWLALFVALGTFRSSSAGTLFLIGTIPIGLFALLLTVFSWPIFLPTPVLMTVAVVKEADRVKSSR